MHLSAIDRKILNSIQEDIPLKSQPFKELSKQVGIEEEELLRKIETFKEQGIIRTFAAGLNHKRLGFLSTLVGLRVSLDDADVIAGEFAKYSEVTHCYLREGDFNLWMVFLCLEKEKLDNFLKRLTEKVGKENILNLRTKKKFKLRSRLKI